MNRQADYYADSETLTLELEQPVFPAPVIVREGPDRSDIFRLVVEAVASAASPDDMLHALFEDTKDALGIDAYFNFMINERGDALTLASYEGIAREDARKIERLEFGRGISGNVALKRTPIVVADLQNSTDPRVEMVKGYGIRAYACNPVLSGEHLLGTLSFASRTRTRFSDTELELFREIARQVACAYIRLRRSGQRRESDRRTHEFLVSLLQDLKDPEAPIRVALDVVRQKSAVDPDLQDACLTIERQLQNKMQVLSGLLESSATAESPTITAPALVMPLTLEAAAPEAVAPEGPEALAQKPQALKSDALKPEAVKPEVAVPTAVVAASVAEAVADSESLATLETPAESEAVAKSEAPVVDPTASATVETLTDATVEVDMTFTYELDALLAGSER